MGSCKQQAQGAAVTALPGGDHLTLRSTKTLQNTPLSQRETLGKENSIMIELHFLGTTCKFPDTIP